MTTCMGKNCSTDLLCVSFVNVYQFVCVLLSLLVLRADVAFDCINPDHCISVYFTEQIKVAINL